MRFFSSHRERRLWLWTLAVVVAIYSTLGLTGMLAGFLRERGLGAPLFLLFMLLVAATVVTHGIKARAGRAEIAVALGVATAYLLVFFRMSILEERSHLIEYGVLGILIYAALVERASQGRRVPLPPLLAVVATTVLGVLDEGIQWFLPTRVFDPQDILFNFLAGAMAVGASIALAWARRKTMSRRARDSARPPGRPKEPEPVHHGSESSDPRRQ
ncbi:MAG: VanZ family protein [Chloroflexi bacterium]|nr:VanZ family protein [Chloroflexota bacterium]MCY3937445.1 VanZ family protein [Chloroflexota bacterium]